MTLDKPVRMRVAMPARVLGRVRATVTVEPYSP
jgi:hypothetical protein